MENQEPKQSSEEIDRKANTLEQVVDHLSVELKSLANSKPKETSILMAEILRKIEELK